MRFSRRLPVPLAPQPDCHAVGAVLQAYLDGELGPQDAEIVAEHLQHCERCGIESTTVLRVIDAIRRQRPDLDADAIERLSGFVDSITRDGPQSDDGSPSGPTAEN